MNKGPIQLFLKREYNKFFTGYLIIFIFSCLVTFIFGLYQKNNQLCQSFIVRANDLNEIIAREKLIGSNSTINFELKKLQSQFNLSSVSFEVLNNNINSISCQVSPLGFNTNFPVIFGTQIMGEIKASKKATSEDLFFAISFLIPLSIGVLGTLFLLSNINKRFKTHVLNPLTQISDEVRNISDFKTIKSEHLPFDEFIMLVDSINKMNLQLKETSLKVHGLEANSKIAEAAKQVSHDIRSPISALNMVVGQLQNIPEQHRLLIRHSVNRINDIANSLLERGKQKDIELVDNLNARTKMKVEMLGSMIDVLVSEKRTQFRNKPNIEIEAKLKNSYGAFVKVNSTELKRVLSNLITNSVEALDARSGLIQISVIQDKKQNIIRIEDNGKGIPDSVLAKLGEQGVTHGKNGTESGSGLGVYHAKKTIESFGGQFKIESTLEVGTTITMIFPREEPPEWFVSSLKIRHGLTVVITDDDSSIHGLWTERFKGLNAPIQELHYSSDETLSNWHINRDLNQTYLFLMDYELLGCQKNGLDLIENLKLNSDAILVTSRYDEQDVRARCKKNGVKLIPKGMSEFVPIIIE